MADQTSTDPRTEERGSVSVQSPDWLTERARVAALSRSRPEDDPELVDARRRLRAARAEAYIRDLVDRAPKLNPEEIDRLRGLLPARK